MARITVNTSGTFPHIYLSENLTAVPAGDPLSPTGKLEVRCLQDITISNSTVIFSWTDFCSPAINKLTTPIVIWTACDGHFLILKYLAKLQCSECVASDQNKPFITSKITNISNKSSIFYLL